jgi:hypothetical protein
MFKSISVSDQYIQPPAQEQKLNIPLIMTLYMTQIFVSLSSFLFKNMIVNV